MAVRAGMTWTGVGGMGYGADAGAIAFALCFERFLEVLDTAATMKRAHLTVCKTVQERRQIVVGQDRRTVAALVCTVMQHCCADRLPRTCSTRPDVLTMSQCARRESS